MAGTNNSSSIFNETASRQVHQRPQFQPLARAAYDLAMLSLTGLASSLYPRNESYGLDLLHSSGQAGNVQARIALAYRYLQGRGVSQDCDKAFRFRPPPREQRPRVVVLQRLFKSALYLSIYAIFPSAQFEHIQ